jgi:hypothetical protein
VPPDLARRQQWPGWYFDAQSASEYAHQLSSHLAASVNTTTVARTWLDQYPLPAHHPHRHHHPAGGGGGQPPATVQQQRPAPRRHLNATGVTAAISMILGGLLAQLWAAAAAVGWASAVSVLGVGALEGAEVALADLMKAGQGRLRGIIRTRISRIERALLAALRDGTSVDALAAEISAILGSGVSALLVTLTETTWASQQAALAAYQVAGVAEVIWQTRNDGLVCANCLANQAAGPKPVGTIFPSGDKAPPAHPRCRCSLIPAQPPKPGAKKP